MYSKNLDVLQPEDARKLLSSIAPRVGRHAREMAKLCGYLPLALRAAGNLVAATRDLNVAAYVEALRDERTRLEQIGAEGVDVGVEASLNESHRQLEEEAARVFRWLAALEIAIEIGDRRSEGNWLYGLGLACANLGEPRQAIELCEV